MELKEINLNDDVFKFVYVAAMRDAVLQLAYNGNKKWLTEETMYISLKEILKPLVDKVLKNEYLSQEDYNADFLNVAIKICDCVNGKAQNNNFTFGNAQKLINIMMKYFYITSYANDCKKEYFRFCHCPMDSILLEKVWEKRKEISREIDLKSRKFFLKSWGNEEFKNDNGKRGYPERYEVFQYAVQYLAKHCDRSSLEYDYLVW